MSVSKKEFVLTHVIKNAPSMVENKRNCSEDEEHFNVAWNLIYYRKNGFLSLYLYCNESSRKEKWSIRVNKKLMLISVNGKNLIRGGGENTIENSNGDKNLGWGSHEFIKWEDLEKNYMVDGTFTIEAHVEILEMTGIPKKKLRIFDESMRDWSDVVLIVENEKFYVSKLFLGSHSTYFNSLLLGNFKESKKKEIALKNINSVDFQNFLEVLYGESAIDDDTVEGILKLADMYDAQTAHRRCEEFLKKNSGKSTRMKLEISAKYHLNRLQKKCLADIKTVADIRDVLPGDLQSMDKSVMAAILQKAMSLHQ